MSILVTKSRNSVSKIIMMQVTQITNGCYSVVLEDTVKPGNSKPLGSKVQALVNFLLLANRKSCFRP